MVQRHCSQFLEWLLKVIEKIPSIVMAPRLLMLCHQILLKSLAISWTMRKMTLELFISYYFYSTLYSGIGVSCEFLWNNNLATHFCCSFRSNLVALFTTRSGQYSCKHWEHFLLHIMASPLAIFYTILSAPTLCLWGLAVCVLKAMTY